MIRSCDSATVIAVTMSMSTYIYIAHKHETSNALYMLVQSKEERFQVWSNCISANRSITQRIPHQQTSRREILSGFNFKLNCP